MGQEENGGKKEGGGWETGSGEAKEVIKSGKRKERDR